MTYTHRAGRIRAGALLLVVTSLLLGPGLVQSYAVTPSPTNLPANASGLTDPTGLALTPTRFLIVRCTDDGNEVRVQSVGVDGTLSNFGPAVSGGCLHPAIGIAPSTDGYIGSGIPRQNRAGFRAGFAYFTQTTSGGTTIWQLDLSGNRTQFYPVPPTPPVPCSSPAYADLAFQTVVSAADFQGPFGNHGLMFVTCTTGKIWKVNNAGAPVLEDVADLLTQGIDNIQGPSQAPLAFSLAPGYLCVASPTESSGKVFCVTKSGAIVTVVTVKDGWPDANGVDFFPGKCRFDPAPGTTGTAQGGSFYVSTPTSGGTIFKYLPAAFSTFFNTDNPPKPNAAIVTRAGNNQPTKALGKLTSNAGGTITAFDAAPGRFQHAAGFVDCSVPTVVSVDVSPGQKETVINQSSQGTVPIAIVGSTAVPANSIVASSVHCGLTGSNLEAVAMNPQIKDISGPIGLPDGILDFVGYFERTQMGLEGLESPYRGPIICRGEYNTGAIDPRFDGGG